MKYLLKTNVNESGNTIISKEKRNGKNVYLVMNENKETQIVDKEWLIKHKDYVVNLTVSADNKILLKTSSSTSPTQKKPEDFGEKIGGARKDNWKYRGLELIDISNFTYLEREKYITKDNIWLKPNYEKMVNEDGYDILAAFFIKGVRTRLSTKPIYSYLPEDTENNRIIRQNNFMNVIKTIKDKALSIKKEGQIKGLSLDFLVEKGFIKTNGRYIEDTEEGAYSISCGLVNFIESSNNLDWLKSEMKRAKFLEDVEKPKTVNNSNRKQKIKIEPLKDLQGQSYRNGKQIEGQDYLNCFRFRGGEFGNWLNDNDRLQSLNYGYDALKDLASVLGISDKDISLGGKLAIAFGSRGTSNAAAHFEPERNVINLTKMNGAGSLAHEWGHAFDYFLGQLSGLKCYLTDDYSNAIPSFAEVMVAIKTQPKKVDTDFLKRVIVSWKEEITNIFHEQFLYYRNLNQQEKTEYNSALDKILNNRKITFPNLVNIKYEPNNNIVNILKEKMRNIEVPFIVDTIFPVLDRIYSVRNDMIGRNQFKPYNSYYRTIIYDLCLLNFFRDRLDNADNEYDFIPSNYLTDAEYLNKTATRMGDNYWNSDSELFARAFACYVKDRLGRRSDYLVGHADSIEYGSPKGKEREKINLAFDKLFEDLKRRNILHKR